MSDKEGQESGWIYFLDATRKYLGAQIAFLAIFAGVGFIFFGTTSWSKREEENHGAK